MIANFIFVVFKSGLSFCVTSGIHSNRQKFIHSVIYYLNSFVEMEGPSVKVAPTMPSNLKASIRPLGPTEPNCLAQLSQSHPLQQSEVNYNKNKLNISMQMLRNGAGLHAPLKLSMELRAAEKVGRLPFLPSSNIQRDVLLGRDELIEFSDFLGTEENCEVLRQPHAVIEKSLGIL